MPSLDQIRRYLTMFACGPPVGVLVADFTITVGAGQDWYREGQSGSATGDLEVAPGLTVNRFRHIGSANITLNRAGTLAWSAWVAANPGYRIEVSTPHGDFELNAGNLDDAGGGFIRFIIDSAGADIADMVAAGDAVRVQVFA